MRTKTSVAFLLAMFSVFMQNVKGDLNPEVQEILQAIEATLTQLGDGEGLGGSELAAITTAIASDIKDYLKKNEAIFNEVDLRMLIQNALPGEEILTVDEEMDEDINFVLVTDLSVALYLWDVLAQMLAESDESTPKQVNTILLALQLTCETISQAAEMVEMVHYDHGHDHEVTDRDRSHKIKRDFLGTHFNEERADSEKRDVLDVHIHRKRDDAEISEEKRFSIDIHIDGKRDAAETPEKKRM